MLVLSRKESEQLLIGDNIVLTINRISGNRVAIGIEAPREVAIVRGELDRRDVAVDGNDGTSQKADQRDTAATSLGGNGKVRSGGVAPMSTPLNDSVAMASKPHH